MGKNGNAGLKLNKVTYKPAIDAAERYNRLLEILLEIASYEDKDFIRKNSANLEIVNKNKANSKMESGKKIVLVHDSHSIGCTQRR